MTRLPEDDPAKKYKLKPYKQNQSSINEWKKQKEESKMQEEMKQKMNKLNQK